MEPRADRAELELERGRDLLVREPFEVAEDDDDPAFLAELGDRPVQRRLQLVPLHFLGRPDLARRQAGQGLFALARHAPLARAEAVQAQARGDRVEPRRELRVAPELADGSMHAQEDFLGELLGLGAIAQHTQRDAEDAVLVGDHQILEGSGIAAPEPVHQGCIIAGPPFHPVRPYRSWRVPPAFNFAAARCACVRPGPYCEDRRGRQATEMRKEVRCWRKARRASSPSTGCGRGTAMTSIASWRTMQTMSC